MSREQFEKLKQDGGVQMVDQLLERIEQGKCTPAFAAAFRAMTPEQQQASAARIEALRQKKLNELHPQR